VLYLHEIEEGRASHLPGIVAPVLDLRDDVVFIVAGDGRYRQTLETRLEKYIEEDRVLFVGKVPNTETPKYYAAADVYIMTSNFEAFSRVLLEAMAMGTPYVATDGGGSIRAYTPQEHQPFILAESELQKFPDRVCEILDNTETAKILKDAGQEHVRNYSLDTVLDRFVQVVSEDQS